MEKDHLIAWKQQWLRQGGAPQIPSGTYTRGNDDNRGDSELSALIWPFHEWEKALEELRETTTQSDKKPGSKAEELYTALQRRYGSLEVIEERISALSSFLHESKKSHGFSSEALTLIACGSGRDRVFMGHSDLPGLGGMTLDAATKQELFVMMQWDVSSSNEEDGSAKRMQVNMSNHFSDEFPSASFSLESILELASALSQPSEESLLEKAKRVANANRMKDVWDQKYWIGYVHAALTYMLSSLYYDHPLGYASFPRCSEREFPLPESAVLKIHVGSLGRLTLPHTGGISSSAAMTGAVSLCLNQLFQLGLSTEELVTVDFAEYLLGKTSGTSDKAAQLFAQRGELVSTSSLPVKFLGTVKLPSDLKVLMCASPIPRLSTPTGFRWLQEQFDYSRAQSVNAWALHTLVSCGSTCTKIATNFLFDRLHEEKWLQHCGISEDEGMMLRQSLLSHGHVLLRGLLTGEELQEKIQRTNSSIDNARYRLSLIYKALKMVPSSCHLDEEGNVQPPLESSQRAELYSLRGHTTCDTVFHPRGAALYGLSEMERGKKFMRLCSESGNSETSKILIQLLRLSQLGDKACVDYRRCYTCESSTNNEEGMIVNGYCFPYVENHEEFMITSDDRLDKYAADPDRHPLWACYGSFQRSLPDFDELEEKLHKTFGEEASLRVAAAGLGGFAIVYCRERTLKEVTNFLKENHWGVRHVDPGSRSQVL